MPLGGPHEVVRYVRHFDQVDDPEHGILRLRILIAEVRHIPPRVQKEICRTCRREDRGRYG
jgi:hypothetical protein